MKETEGLFLTRSLFHSIITLVLVALGPVTALSKEASGTSELLISAFQW